MNANPELVAAAGAFLGSLLFGWVRAWRSTRKNSILARAAIEQLAKSICYEIRAEASRGYTSQEVIAEFTRRARNYTSSEQLNQELMGLEESEIIWNMEKVKVRAGDVTEW